MTQALIEIQRVLSEANAAGKLTDTIWRGPAETLFDYIQNEIDAAGTTGCTDQHQIAEPQKFTVDSEMSRAFEIEYGQDWKDPDWRRETGVWASAWHKATNAARAAAPQAVQPAVPVLFVSREQLESHTDHLASEAGRYLPARKTALGKFTMPLYAHPAEGVPAQAFKTKVYQALGIGSACNEDAVFVNIENARRRADCLSAIEREFFMVETPPDESEGDTEPGEECLLNWGHAPTQYVQQFAKALAATQPAAQGLDAQRWGVVANHWKKATFKYDRKGDLESFVVSIDLSKQGLGARTIASTFDEALTVLAAQAKQGGAA